ncbi:MAG: helix-turn-helix domain-containing protein [Ruminococcus sp.]|nr:helix-turn-helix domain-containing protein [Ruminococcus sp.]
MGAPRVTPEEIVEMLQLYNKYGNYAAVGREIGRSGSTVSKYVQMKGVPLNIQIAVQNLLNERK